MSSYTVNWWRLWFAAVFFVQENYYFGWNRYAQSAEELMADGLVLLIASMAFTRSRA